MLCAFERDALLAATAGGRVFTTVYRGASGAELASAIRSEHVWDAIPVIAVTADNDLSATYDASVFEDVLVKPVSADSLRSVLFRLFPPVGVA